MISVDDKELLDAIFEGVDDCDEPVLLNDSNFDSVKSEITDSLFGLLANVGLAVAEQKKLLQVANTPLGLQTAVKLMGVTVGNLLHASTSMLGWMGKVLSKDEIMYDSVNDGALTDLLKGLSKRISGMFSKAMGDNLENDLELHYQVLFNGVNNSILHRVSKNDWIIAYGYDVVDKTWKSSKEGFESFNSALAELNKR